MRWCSLLALFIVLHGGVLQASPTKVDALPNGIKCLLESYPEHLCSATATTLVWCDGTKMLYDDGKKKTYDELLNHPDLEDMMSMRYQPGRAYPIPAKNFDPGRVRYEPFFRKMYGDSAKAVQKTLAPVRWMTKSGGKVVNVTHTNNVDRQLQAVSDALSKQLPPHVAVHIAKSSGTFVWRTVKGTKRLSTHSFAMGIDVGVKAYSDYWRWGGKTASGTLTYRNRFPLNVVEVFEQHGFIWGGKWYHYDTMHFEYRPELLHPLCAKTP